MPHLHETYMRRCLALARQGAGQVAPNPMVGAVLVHNDRIIGEGYHQRYGEAHAEVNCIASVQSADIPLIAAATLYVSLEPCAHFGKTPPCADLIIRHNIPHVVIGCSDAFAEVDGKGIAKLKQTGITVTCFVLEKECLDINRRFFTFHQKHRPYVILKWAMTADGKMAYGPERTGERLLISNEATNRLVHKWRSEEAAILVGRKTALLDNPSLNNRYWTGNNPVRLVLDPQLQLPNDLALFNQQQPTIVFNTQRTGGTGNLLYEKVAAENVLHDLLQHSYQRGIQSILVEGGAALLQSFIDAGMWDEARVIVNTTMQLPEGLSAPVLSNVHETDRIAIKQDHIYTYQNRAA